MPLVLAMGWSGGPRWIVDHGECRHTEGMLTGACFRRFLAIGTIGAVHCMGVVGCSARPDGPGEPSSQAQVPPVAAQTSPTVEPLPAAEALVGLLPGAAVYFTVRLDDVFARLIAPVKEQLQLDAISRALGSEGPPDAALRAIGVDTSRALLGSVVPASEKDALLVIDAIAAGATNEALAAVIQAHAGEATRVRLLVPLIKGAEASRVAAALGKALGGDGSMASCPGAPACTAFAATAPLGVIQGPVAAAAAYADGPDLRLDVVQPLFVAGTDPAVLTALVAMRDARGGFEGRCSTLDTSASASVCVDSGPAGELAATLGYAEMVGYARLEPWTHNASMRSEMAVVGRPLARDSLWLAAPPRRLATDGTVSFLASSEPMSVRASWALTDAARSSVAAAFATERCASGQAVFDELVPALRAAFGEPGEGFSGPETQRRFAAAEGRLLGALSGTWPNLLDIFSGAPAGEFGIPPALKACFHHQDGRLILDVKQGP